MKLTPKKNKIHRSAFFVALAAVPLLSSLAQDEQANAAEAVYQLSPFEISTDSEVGYMATQTLSGTRMRSDLGDVGSSIEVLTKEFLDDMGATNMYDALDFVGNIETYGKSGGLSENENEVFFSSPYVARGFRTASRMSDFFTASKAPVDFYNTTNFTVARGPNAVLFGIGSPGGVVNVSRKRAMFGASLTEVQLRTDNYGSFRSTLDLSRELIEGKLAVRAALLYDDRKEFLKPAGFERNAAYASITYRPFETTSITVTGDKGSEERIFQYTTVNYDAVTPWLNAGQPIYDGDLANINPMNTSIGSGLDRERKMVLVISGQPGISNQDWWRMARTERFEIAGHPNMNAIRQTSYTADNAIWDIDDIQLTGTSRQREMDWENFSIFLTQELFVPELQLEVAYNYSQTEYLMVNTFGHFFVQMDANERLPNGDPNPNLGVPYVESDRTDVIGEENTLETLRATLSYTLDLNHKEVFGIGLGRYSVMGLYEDERQHSLFAGFRRVYTELGIPGYNSNNWLSALNSVRTRTYLDTSITPAGANVEPYYKHDFNPVDQNGIATGWGRHTSPRDINDTRESQVLALQAYLWRTEENYDRVILTAGFRNDKQTSQRDLYFRTSQRVFEGQNWRGSPWDVDKTAFFDGTVNFGVPGEKSVVDVPTKTYSAVFKATENLSFFYNFSDVVISASSLFTDIYDEFVDGTVGETDDFGVRWSLLDNKVVASLTLFETTALRQRENNVRTIFTPDMQNIWEVVDPNREIHQGFNERYVTLRDDSSEGVEFSLVANLKPGWNTRLSISKIETIINDRLPVVDRYLAEFMPLWESNRSLALSAGVANETDYQTVGDAIDTLNREIGDLKALIGTVPNAQRDWKVVFNTNYRFRDGALKGLAIGGGFRWQDKDIIGYAYDERNIVDPNKPFYGDELLDVNASVSYSTQLWGRDVRLQLNVTNLLGDDGTFARSAVDDLTGNPYYGRQQVKQPRSFIFTATFDL